jgi:hypothetical protein
VADPFNERVEIFMRRVLLAILAATLLGACSPEVGSDAWCKSLKEKNVSDWESQETKDFAKHCIFK